MINIAQADKAAVLAALYNASRPLELGILHFDPTPMTTEQAREILAEYTRFDYLQGRVMKVDLSGTKLDPRLYDRDNGLGAAAAALASVSGCVTTES